MAKVQRTQQELERAYRIQLASLKTRCDSYYNDGLFYESYSISTIIRVLLHDTSVSHSLMGQLGTKNTTQYLDSISTGNLYMMGIMNGFSGLHPRTRMPYKQYNASNHFDFDTWWQQQEFKVLAHSFTRKDLILKVANMEGGAHIDTQIDERLAQINRSSSPYHAIVGEENYPLYGAELASVCAIGEELLFTLTPEPENRKRMLYEAWQKPFYLNQEESDQQKELIKKDLEKLTLELEKEPSQIQQNYIRTAIKNTQETLNIPILNSEDCEVRKGTKYLMDLVKIPWIIED